MNDLLQIFNPEWWMNENNSALQMTDAVMFLLLAIPVAYLLLFALASVPKYHNPYPHTNRLHRFLVVFTVLENGKEVIESVNHFLDTQAYPKEKYDVVVAATRLPEEDLATLLQMPINIVIPDKEQCTKVYAIQQVVERYSPKDYDAIVLFNQDNIIMPTALELFNNSYYSGCEAIQAHRMPENLDSNIAVLSAASEEINNSLFRRAHTVLGFSSALIGSSMMFDFEMFHRIAPKLTGSDLTKAMEIELLRENTYVEYLQDVVSYYKTSSDAAGYSQTRQRWLSAQYRSTMLALVQFPIAFLQGKWDLCEKMFQWLMPSRMLLIAYIVFFTIVITFLNWSLCFKWYGLLIALGVSFIIALPSGEISRRFRKALWALPILIFTSAFSHVLNIFKKVGRK